MERKKKFKVSLLVLYLADVVGDLGLLPHGVTQPDVHLRPLPAAPSRLLLLHVQLRPLPLQPLVLWPGQAE